MTRTTKAELESTVGTLNKLLPGGGYRLDWHGRACLVDKDGAHLGPRLPKGQLYDWLWGFIAGVRIAQENVTIQFIRTQRKH